MPVTILGVHRSGTSMLARLLNLSGVYLGEEEDLVMERRGNEKGCWEHQTFMDLNHEILAHFGGTLEDPPLLPRGWWKSAELESIRDEAMDFVAYAFGERALWGWKDPQTTLTCPFWRQIVPGLKAVIAIRNPLDVAASILVHNGGQTTERKGLALWQHYTETALRATMPEERIVTFYEDYFADPQALDPVLAFLGLPPTEPGSATAAAISEFIDRNLKHHGRALQDVLRSPDVFLVTKLLYFCLRTHPADVDTILAFPFPVELIERGWGPTEEEARQTQQACISRMARDLSWQATHIGHLQAWVTRQREALDWHDQHRTALESELQQLRERVAELEQQRPMELPQAR